MNAKARKVKIKTTKEQVELNVGGQIVETKLSVLSKIRGSILADSVNGEVFAPVDEKGRMLIAADPDVF